MTPAAALPAENEVMARKVTTDSRLAMVSRAVLAILATLAESFHLLTGFSRDAATAAAFVFLQEEI